MTSAADLVISICVDNKTERHEIRTGLQLPIFVIFTSVNETMKVLQKAIQLAKPLKTGIEVLNVQTAPYRLPLNDPTIPASYVGKRLREMVALYPENIRISDYICRDTVEALKLILNRNCPVAVGIRKRWWPTRHARLARRLRHAGYNVIPVEAE